MKRASKSGGSNSSKEFATPLSSEARENYLISLAMDRVEERLRDGTASSSEIVHFLRLGSEKARIENEKLEEEVKHLKAKTEAIESAQRSEELYAEAIKSMQRYSGQSTGDEDEVSDLL